MKKLLITVLSLAVISYALFADVETEYNRKRLVIQYYSGISGSWSEKGGSISSYSNWRFHEGFRKITEAEFLEIAGYTAEAKQAEKHK